METDFLTKQDLELELARLRLEIREKLDSNLRWTITLLLGLYATNIGFGILILLK